MTTTRSQGRLTRLIGPYRGFGPSLWTMFLATMVNRFGDFVAFFLSLYLTKSLGMPPSAAGGIVAVAFLASSLGSLASGRLADSLGRKSTLLLVQTLAASFSLAMGFLYREAWAPWLIVAGNLFRGGARPLINAVLTDLSPAGKRKEVFAIQYWSINVGVALGPLAAGFLFDHARAWIFWGDGLSTLAAVVLIARGVRVVRSAAAESHLEHRDERGALRAFLARPILLAFAAIGLASSITYSQTGFSLPITVARAMGDAGPRFSGVLMSLNATAVILLSILVARLLRRRSPLFCMAASAPFYILGFGAYALPLSSLGFALATFAWTMGEIVAATNMGVFMAKHSPENWRASFQSFMGVFYSLGWSVGPLVGGFLMGAGGPPLLWLCTVGVCVLWGLGSVGLDRWDRRLGAEY